MIGNIVEYVHSYGYFDFEALPFGSVDALVLGQFVYLKLEGLVGGFETEQGITLRELQKHPKAEKLFADPRWRDSNRALFQEMCESRRFGNMKLLYLADRICMENETQFMAVTCVLSDGSVKVLYRGTDETIVGWKEDFNMAFQYPIPGQSTGRAYLELVLAHRTEEKVDLIGHSKGGNLAVYAAMHAAQSLQDRIGRIYNLDGPGFRTEVYSMESFDRIADRIVKIIPRSSIIGMLLENHGAYKVVESSSVGLLQHDPFSWKIDRIDFVYLNEMDELHRVMDESLNAWIMSLSTDEVSAFVNTLYQIVEASEATDLISFTKNWTKSIAGMAGAIQNLDEATKNSMYKIMKSLANISKNRIKEETGIFLQTKLGELSQRIGKEGTK